MTGNPNQPRASAVSVTETGHRVAIALGEAREGRLEFANGVARLTIRNADPMDDILRARFQGWPPRVRLDDGAIVMRYPRRFKPFEWRRRKAQVELNPSVPWEIVIRGGASEVRADLRSFELRAVLIGGGRATSSCSCPSPRDPSTCGSAVGRARSGSFVHARCRLASTSSTAPRRWRSMTRRSSCRRAAPAPQRWVR